MHISRQRNYQIHPQSVLLYLVNMYSKANVMNS